MPDTSSQPKKIARQSRRKPPLVKLIFDDALNAIKALPDKSVDCIVTSPPYYGQRDYGFEGQIGLESDPNVYIERLVEIFAAAERILKKEGSLWINLGDTYWSGRGAAHSSDAKNKHRRFLRPQDKRGPHEWCKQKQLLLLPHRFAIALQGKGWILRNDNVWHKVSPTPDPVKDRSACAHEYMFHFVLSRHYYYDFSAVAEPCKSDPKSIKPPASVWSISNRPSFKKHAAVFPSELVTLPILATLPARGTILDPFCGSGTALETARKLKPSAKLIGIDLGREALEEAATRLGVSNHSVSWEAVNKSGPKSSASLLPASQGAGVSKSKLSKKVS